MLETVRIDAVHECQFAAVAGIQFNLYMEVDAVASYQVSVAWTDETFLCAVLGAEPEHQLGLCAAVQLLQVWHGGTRTQRQPRHDLHHLALTCSTVQTQLVPMRHHLSKCSSTTLRTCRSACTCVDVCDRDLSTVFYVNLPSLVTPQGDSHKIHMICRCMVLLAFCCCQVCRFGNKIAEQATTNTTLSLDL